MKNVLITGINKGLGKELFDQLVEKGYFVYGLLRNEETFNELQQRKQNNSELIFADLTDDKCIDSIQQVVKNNRIDLVINNAGIGGTATKLEDVETEEILKLFNVHCLGVLRVMKAVSNNLVKNDDTVVINLNSRLGSITHQSIGTFKNLEVSYSYRIAKAAQNMLTTCLRKEFDQKIKFVSLTPGKLKTELAQTNADLEPSESARRIIDFWEKGKFETINGIMEVPDKILEW